MWCSSRWCGAKRAAAPGHARRHPAPCAGRRAAARIAGSVAVAMLVAPTLVVAPPARARELPPPVRATLPEARLAGSGRLTYFGLHVYDAQLFVPADFNARRFADQPFGLELTYARRLDGHLIAERSRDEMAKLGAGSEAQRERWLATMTKLFPDVDRGRRLLGINLPGVGARFFADDRPLGDVDDPAFARAFFAIWLDERTSEPQLRAQLLQQRAR